MTDGETEYKSVPQLISAVEETESYAFLIGAGTSRPKPAGIPTAGELIQQWREEYYDIEDPKEDFDDWVTEKEEDVKENEKYGFWFEERHPTRGQRREFIRDLVEDADLTPAHIILASLMSDDGKQNYVPHALTPNFDDLLFDAFYLYLEDKPQLVDHRAVAPEFKLTRNRPAIVKLHGDYLYNNLRNTEEETEALEQGMEDALRKTVGEYGLVVIGYGGEDESIMNALLDAEISEYGIYWCARNPEKLSGKAEELLKQSDSYVVEIEGFESLMAQFGETIDDVEPPTRDDLIDRAKERADRLEGAVEERKEAATDEEKEYLDKWSMVSNALEASEEGEYRKAIAIYDGILEQDPEYVLAYFNRGNAKFELGEYEAASKEYTQALELDSEYPEAFYNRGLAKGKLGEHEAAIDDYTQALELDPEDPEAFYSRGSAKGNLGEYEAANEDFTRALELDPEYPKAFYSRGLAKSKVGEYEAAIDDYTQALELDPEYPEAFYNRGLAKSKVGKYEAAVDDYDRALELDSEYPEAFYNRGLAKSKVGKYEAAIDDYDRALELDSENISALLNRAEAEIEVGNFEQARLDADEAKSLSSTTDDSAKSLLLKQISSIALDHEIDDIEQDYRSLCEEDFTTTWSFEELDAWIENADLQSTKKENVEELIDLLREHKEDAT